jgi:hypothetical protein
MSILTTAERLIRAIEAHAGEIHGDGRASVPAEAELRVAAAEYSQAAGFEDVAEMFSCDEEDDGFEDDDIEGAESAEIPNSVERISLFGRWDFLVADREQWIRFAETTLSSDVSIDNPVRALFLLLERFPLEAAYASHGLNSGGSQWSVEPVERVLFEMTDTERDELIISFSLDRFIED